MIGIDVRRVRLGDLHTDEQRALPSRLGSAILQRAPPVHRKPYVQSLCNTPVSGPEMHGIDFRYS
jgi:hypothetical protein